MCFSSKDARDSGDTPPRPVHLSQTASKGKSSYSPPQAQLPQQQPAEQSDAYASPPGPPPSHTARPANNNYAPPAGPPPGHSSHPDAASSSNDYAPPPGPPPGYDGSSGSGDYAPPPGPPPGKGQEKVHDWESAVPDNSLLPPPPNLFAGWDRSPTNNATEDEAEQGKAWCFQYPINTAMNVQNNKATAEAIKHFNFNLQVPSTYQGKFEKRGHGTWVGDTKKRSTDSCIVSFPPLYAANLHSPQPGRPFTAYYEVHIARDNRKEVSLAMGFAAMPYPHFRLPGWHRGSLAVHGDDGHRYVNDTWGGKELIDGNYRLKPGGKYGIGMTFSRKDGAGYGPAPDTIDVEVFFTDNGRIVAKWDLHEEIDAEQDLPVTGLEGDYDLSAAIGTFDAVKFEVHLNPEQWAYQEMKTQKLAEMRS
ncbi:hypothetical protein SEUCBS139899_008572 [Sporothrix eucalyptigena]